MSANPSASPIWFIKGCSTGFGRELALAVLARGWRCVATARNQASLDDLEPEAGDRVLHVALDVTDQAQIDAAVAAAQAQLGAIDVLVNNAGYGYQSTIEEGGEREIRAQFDANVFGLFAVTRAVHARHARAPQGACHQHQVGGGSRGLPGLGLLRGQQAVHRYIQVRAQVGYGPSRLMAS